MISLTSKSHEQLRQAKIIIAALKAHDEAQNTKKITDSQSQPPITADAAVRLRVISSASDLATVQALLDLEHDAQKARVALLPAISASPGASTLLAHWLSADFDITERITTANYGLDITNQPGICRIGTKISEVDGAQLVTKRATLGGTQIWFPPPIGPVDCYRNALAEPLVLHRDFNKTDRIIALTSRQPGSNQSLFTRLIRALKVSQDSPAQDVFGASWVEVRGRNESGYHHRVMAIAGEPAAITAATLAVVANYLNQTSKTPPKDGSIWTLGGLGEDPGLLSQRLLTDLCHFVKVFIYTGEADPLKGVAKSRVASKNILVRGSNGLDSKPDGV